MGNFNSGEMEVHYAGLDETATRLADQAKKLEDSLRDIKHEVARVSGLGEGEAHHTYTEQQAAWDREATGIHEALMAISKVVHAAGGDYQGGDRKAASYYM